MAADNNTAENIRRTATEIEEATERVHELARQNVELTRQAHALVHDSPDLSSMVEGSDAEQETAALPEAQAPVSTPDEDPGEEFAGHS